MTRNILGFFNVEIPTVESVTVSTGSTRKPGSTLNLGSTINQGSTLNPGPPTKVTASTVGSGGVSTGKIVKGSLLHFIVAEHKD